MKDDTTMTFTDSDGRTVGPITSKQLREVGKTMKTMALKRDERLAKIPSEGDFKDGDFLESEQLSELGDKLIGFNFPDLAQFKIVFLWKAEGGSKNGKAVLGRATLPKSFAAYYSKADVLITASADHLRFLRADQKMIEAVLYHELCHVKAEEDEKKGWIVYLIGHDFEGFAAELKKYGPWRTDLEGMVETVKQLRLW